MITNEDEPNTAQPWREYQESDSATHPENGSKVFVTVASGKTGPATYHTATGFALFNAPWGALGEVQRWRYQNW